MSWRLTNCLPDCNTNKFYVVNTDLSALEGFVLNGVQITGVPINADSCWIVGPDLAVTSLELEAYDAFYSNCSFCVCKCCAEISPPTYGCAIVPFNSLIGTVFTDSMAVQVSYTSNTTSILLTSFVGDFLGFTLCEVITEIALQITNGGSEFTAAPIDPPCLSLNVCAPATLGEAPVNSQITIQFNSFYYLKNEAPNNYLTSRRLLGYSAGQAKRPVYVADTSPEKLYVPDGNGISYIFPLTFPNDNSAAQILPSTDFTNQGVGTGTQSVFVDTGLSTVFFSVGNTFTLTSINTITDSTNGACPSVPLTCNPPTTFGNQYTLYCEIVSYNSFTGELKFDIYNILRNGATPGLDPGPTMPASTPIKACGDPGYPCGATGGVTIGALDWDFSSTGYGTSTVSVYSCNLVSGALTYQYDVEINVGNVSDACYFPDTQKVAIVGYGQAVGGDLQPQAPMQTIDVNTDLTADFNSTAIIINSLRFDTNSPLGAQRTAYGSQGLGVTFKVDQDLQYDPAVNEAASSGGGIAFNSLGEVYIVSHPIFQSVIRKGGTPDVYNAPDGPPLLSNPAAILFTCLDYTASAPPAFNFNFDTYTVGNNYTLVPPAMSAGLDGLGGGGTFNLIWINGAVFSLSRIVGGFAYTITGIVINYINGPLQGAPSGQLDFTVTSISYVPNPQTVPATPAVFLTTLVGTGLGVWSWAFYPNITGTNDLYFHEPSGLLFLSRITSAGAIIQSYQVVPYVDAATTFGTRTNYFPPGYPVTVLSGNLNFQDCTGSFFMPTSDGSKIYIYDPGTLQWDPVFISKPGAESPQTPGTDGFQKLSYTADCLDPSNINLYSSTPDGTELGVISYFLGPTNRLQGRFIGEITCHPCPPPEAPPLYQRVIPDPVKRFFKIDESICDINATKKFANGYWSKLKKDKFGVTDCCQTDLDVLWLNYEASRVLQLSVSGVTCVQDPAVRRSNCCPWTPVNSCDLIPDPFGGTSIIGFAGEVIAYGKLLMLGTNGRFYLNQPLDLTTYQRAIGFATQSAVTNQQVRVLTSGQIINPGWSLVTGRIYYASPDGDITSTVPSPSGISQVVGYALSPTTLMVDIKQPIIL